MTDRVSRYRLNFKPALLPTEDEEEFYGMYSSLEQALKPSNPIKEMQLNDIAALLWEERRTQRFKSMSVAVGYRSAILRLFQRLGASNAVAEAAANGWFEDAAKRTTATEILRNFNLDETAIEAVALERGLKTYLDADKLEASLGHRRHRALHSMIEFGDAFDVATPEAEQNDGSEGAVESTPAGKTEAA